MERQFSETEEAKRMIVHEQLKAMERYDSCQSVLHSLTTSIVATHTEIMLRLRSKGLGH